MFHGWFDSHKVGEWVSRDTEAGPMSGRAHALVVNVQEWLELFHAPLRCVNLDEFLDVAPGLLFCATVEISKELTTDGELIWSYRYHFHEAAMLGWNEALVPYEDAGETKFRREPAQKFPCFDMTGFFGTAPAALPITRCAL
jgi:hypothetical protein